MKHIFIINPAAGLTDVTQDIQTVIQASEAVADCEFYVTAGAGDATRHVREYCEKHQEPVRFYACGGDGTLNEVVNGVVHYPFAAVGCYPCGSGNDFVKNFGGSEKFLNIASLLSGTEVPVDLLRVGDKYAINAVHFGLDSCVARLISKFRRIKFLGKTRSYTAAVLIALIIGMYHRCRVEVDGVVINPKGSLLLCTIANGQYVGGSYRCAPRAELADGLAEVCLFRPLSHISFALMQKSYRLGEHLERFPGKLEYRRGKSMHITAPKGFIFSMDGELVEQNDFVVEVVERATRFVVPTGAHGF